MARLSAKQSGQEITPEMVEALAAEAEEGYDLSMAKRRVGGRPSLDEGTSPRVSFRATRGLYNALQERASAEGRSVSDLARDAVERYVQSETA